MAPPHLRNNFSLLFTFDYPDFSHIYCTSNVTIVGERHPYIGAFYIGEFLLYFAIYLPSLVVIAREPLRQLACYKLMLMLGVFDNIQGFCLAVLGGYFSIVGANYCENRRLLTVVGHVTHASWLAYCMTCVVLALNRYIQLRSMRLTDRLFGGSRTWYWLGLSLVYGMLGMSATDLAPIYNSQWSSYLFQIDVHNDGPVLNWFCFGNGMWVLCSLTVIYSLMLAELRKRSRVISAPAICGGDGDGKAMGVSEIAKVAAKRERRVQLQCVIICSIIAGASVCYTAAGFLPIPEILAHVATGFLHTGYGITGIVYLVCNPTIGLEVKQLLFGCYKRKGDTSITGMKTLKSGTSAGDNVQQDYAI